MAKETIVHLVDDIDGTKADTTVRFTWSGVDYQIDLSSKNARAFEAAVAPYLTAATRVGAGRKPSARKAAPHLPKLDLAAIRRWAVANEHKVADRGRISTAVLDAYHAAQRSVTGDLSPVPAPTAAVKKTAAKKTAAKTVAAKKAPATKTPATKTAAAKTAAAKKAAPRKKAAPSKAAAATK